MNKLAVAVALALASSVPVSAADIFVQAIPPSTRLANVLVLGNGGKLVGPITVYGPNGEKLFEIQSGATIENQPAIANGTSMPMASGTWNSCCISVAPMTTITPN